MSEQDIFLTNIVAITNMFQMTRKFTVTIYKRKRLKTGRLETEWCIWKNDIEIRKYYTVTNESLSLLYTLGKILLSQYPFLIKCSFTSTNTLHTVIYLPQATCETSFPDNSITCLGVMLLLLLQWPSWPKLPCPNVNKRPS